jgi:hypothetical protein
MTASATIPNTAITGLGTMSTQGADAVAITGGTANGLTIGASNPAAGVFTTLRFNSTLSANGATGTAGQVLTSNGASAPTWQSVAGVGTVTSVDGSGGTTGLTLTGGPITASGTLTLGGTLAIVNGGTNTTSYATGDILYASATDVLSKLTAGSNGQVLTLAAGVPSWATPTTGTVTSVGGTGTVNGLTLTGTVTSSGNLTLGGTLDLSAPPAIGGATPNTGAFTTISATGVVTVSAGTVSAPAITTTGDTNTGIFFPAADTIAFAEGGAEAMRIDSSGNIGIGTTTSASTTALTVQIESPKNTVLQGAGYGVAPAINLRSAGGTVASPSATASSPMNIVGATTDDGTTFRNTISIVGTIESTPTLTSHPTAILFNTTSVNSISRAERMRIDSSGNVGIGTATPGAKLAVVGTGYSPNITLSDAATIAWDTSTGQVATFTFVSSNRTMGAPTNLVNGAFYALAVIQNAGSNTLTWNSVFKWAAGTAPTLSTAAGAKDYFTFRSDGTNLYQQGISQAVA